MIVNSMQRYKKIGITGANSFLGTNVVLEFLSRGVEIRAIVRRSNAVLDSSKGVEVVKGNVTERGDLAKCFKGCDAIVHIAAITDQSLLKYEEYRSFNVGVLSKIIDVAREEGIKRVVFVSSSNTIGNGSKERPADESEPLLAPYNRQFYARSKVEAEALLKEAKDLDGVIVNPCFMLGPYDQKPSSGAMILMGYKKALIFATPGGKNVVDVRSAAGAVCSAIEAGRRGENYLLAGENISIKEFYKMLNRMTKNRGAIIVVPKFLLMMVGYLGDLVRWMGVPTQISSMNMRAICIKEQYTGRKAQSELGMPTTDIEGCVSDAIDWFKREGKVR